MSAKPAETQVWEKLCEFALAPAFLRAQAERLAYHFEPNWSTLQQNLQKLRDEQVLTKERQEFMTHAGATRLNQEELSKGIAVHYEKAARAERIDADLEDVLNANPQSDEERHALFLRKMSMLCWKK